MSYTVQLFNVDQAYGGSEEGGWYFTYGYPVADQELGFKVTRRFKTLAKAKGYRARIQSRLDRLNEQGPSMYSVASQGEYHAYVCTGKPKAFPDSKPYYC